MIPKPLIILLLLFANSILIYSQNPDFSENQKKATYVPGNLIVTIRADSINLTSGTSTFLNVQDIRSRNTRTMMELIGIDTLKRLAPLSFIGDTIKLIEGEKSVKVADMSCVFLIDLPLETNLDSAIVYLKSLPAIINAEPDCYLQFDITEPDDDFYSDDFLWHLNGNYGVSAPGAWDHSKGDDIKIAIIDEGVRITHDDLDDKINGGETTRSGPHGTMVASMAAAETDNGFLTASIGWNSDIVPYNSSGTLSGAISDINSAVSANVDVINMSWGLEVRSGILLDALVSAITNGIVLFGSAGNSFGAEYTYPPFRNFPASFDNLTIAVSANNMYGQVVPNWNYGNFIDVCAPGYDVWVLDDDSDNDYLYGVNGTSFSSPLAAGVAALLLDYDSSLKPRDIEHILELTARDIGSSGFDEYAGWGIIDAEDAIEILNMPNHLTHGTASGGSDYSNNSGHWWMYGMPGNAPDGYYLGYRHEVRKTVSFGATYASAPEVWGRVSGTSGYMSYPDYGSAYLFGYCEPVPGTITTTGATLRTYVYYVSRSGGGYTGWYPCQPSSVSWAYSAFGELSQPTVNISGPTYLYHKQTGTFTANISGGTSPFSYQWYKKYDYQQDWTALGTSSTQQVTMIYDPFTLKVIVTDNFGFTDEDVHYVDTGLWKRSAANGTESTVIPETYTVDQNYPNPFNPATNIRFGLPEDGKVTIDIFNIEGKKLATLADGNYTAGYHTVSFDGSEWPSGVYFYRINMSDFQSIKRMVLLK
jgi:hypothetical protein